MYATLKTIKSFQTLTGLFYKQENPWLCLNNS
jgi:hypothetical protein